MTNLIWVPNNHREPGYLPCDTLQDYLEMLKSTESTMFMGQRTGFRVLVPLGIGHAVFFLPRKLRETVDKKSKMDRNRTNSGKANPSVIIGGGYVQPVWSGLKCSFTYVQLRGYKTAISNPSLTIKSLW